jgi:hypothetical protein
MKKARLFATILCGQAAPSQWVAGKANFNSPPSRLARGASRSGHTLDSKPSPRTDAMVASAIQWAERDHEEKDRHSLSKVDSRQNCRPDFRSVLPLESTALPLRSRERNVQLFRYRYPWAPVADGFSRLYRGSGPYDMGLNCRAFASGFSPSSVGA